MGIGTNPSRGIVLYKGFYISVRVTNESTARRYSIFSEIRQRETDAKPFQGLFKIQQCVGIDEAYECGLDQAKTWIDRPL